MSININKFSELGVEASLGEALLKKAVTKPTPIQEVVIPKILSGENVIGEAPTGTGKTLAYLLPLLTKLDANDKNVQAVIIAPTYELAMQIISMTKELLDLANSPLKALGLIGGANISRQIDVLKKNKPQLIAGSAGRINELFRNGKLNLSNVRFFVLDEFDRLLTKEHLPEVKRLLASIKSATNPMQTLFFSATAPTAALIEAKNIAIAEHICLRDNIDADNAARCEHFYHLAAFREKITALRKLTRRLNIARGIVFVGSTYEADSVNVKLDFEGIISAKLSGSEGKDARKAALSRFRTGKVNLLIATDLAARGLDIADVDYVINLSVAEDVRTYRHRAGRTARAGKAGRVLTLIDAKEKEKLMSLASKMQLSIKRLPLEASGDKIKGKSKGKSKK